VRIYGIVNNLDSFAADFISAGFPYLRQITECVADLVPIKSSPWQEFFTASFLRSDVYDEASSEKSPPRHLVSEKLSCRSEIPREEVFREPCHSQTCGNLNERYGPVCNSREQAAPMATQQFSVKQ
jgi:hypothetical protein